MNPQAENFTFPGANQPSPGIPAPNLLPGTLVLLPVCRSANLISAYYQAGCKVIATNADPLPLLAIESRLTPVDQTALGAAFTRLGDTLKQGQPLSRRIRNLYQTDCPGCKTAVPADYFLWQNNDPHQKHLTCPTCGFSDVTPVTPADLKTLDAIETHGLHYHFLLQRTAAPQSPAYPHAEGLHEYYSHRALYALAEIIMKLEAVISDAPVQRLLKGLLPDCLLPAGNFFGPNEAVAWPQTLRPPKQFIERNVWHLLQARIARWEAPSIAPRFAPSIEDLLRQHQNSIHLSALPAGNSASHLPDESVSLMQTTLPHPNPVGQMLSVMWAGWLLGLKAAEPRHALLRQAHPDWTRYQVGLAAMMRRLHPKLKPDASWLITVEAIDPLHPAAVTLAALSAGFEIDGFEKAAGWHSFTLRHANHQSPQIFKSTLAGVISEEATDAINGFLQSHQTPRPAELFSAAWESLLLCGLLDQAVASLPENEVLSWVSQQINVVIDATGLPFNNLSANLKNST